MLITIVFHRVLKWLGGGATPATFPPLNRPCTYINMFISETGIGKTSNKTVIKKAHRFITAILTSKYA